MIWKEIKTEARYLLKGLLKRLKIDFGALKTWLQILLAAVLFCIFLIRQHSNEKQLTKATEAATEATQAVAGLRDSVRIVERFVEARKVKIDREIKVLQLQDSSQKVIISQLLGEIKTFQISKKDAIRKIDKMNNKQLVNFFSSLPNESLR